MNYYPCLMMVIDAFHHLLVYGYKPEHLEIFVRTSLEMIEAYEEGQEDVFKQKLAFILSLKAEDDQ